MLGSERRVVITGLGVISPIGNDLGTFWSALEHGRGGVAAIKSFAIEGLPSNAGGEVKDFDAKSFAIPRVKKAFQKSLKFMARDIQLAVAAAMSAVKDAGLADGGVDPTRFGVDLGAGLISTELDELAPAILRSTRADGTFDFDLWGREGIPIIQPLWLLKYLPNMLATHISILIDCQAASNTITEAEAAANLAIGEASRIIERNRADLMITGGADSKIHPLSLVRMSLLDQMSRWRGDPSQSCKPFDIRRDGWVAGEGAGILVIEEREHALKRGARIHGEILGCGSGCDAMPGGGLDPNGVGTEIAIRAALKDAGLKPSEIGHVNAHGAASQLSDLAEARAFKRLFGTNPGVPVTALRGFYGNLVSGCGSVDLIASLLGVQHGLIPPMLNCEQLDPECEIDAVIGKPRPTSNPIFVNINLTRHGQASAVVVKGEPIA